MDYQLSGVYHGYETPREVVEETANILTMWERLEQSFSNLHPDKKKWLAENSKPFGKDVQFPGFDGNNESPYVSAARFFVDSLDRFQHFKGRELNAHMPTLQAYRRMLAVFDPILLQVSNQDCSAAQIAEVLNAWRG